MSFFAAAMWSASALLGLDLMTRLLASTRPSGQLDLVSSVLCQGVAFLVTLFFVVLVHDRERSLSDALGLRRVSIVLCLIALALGVALHGPLTLISNAIYARFPPSDEELQTIRNLLHAPTLPQRVVLATSVGLVGPVVEEMFFRGGILRSVRQNHTAGLTLFGTSLLFAGAHLNPRSFFPTFLGGVAMGYVRILSGSLWPAILVHAAFNSGSILVALKIDPDADLFTRPQSFAAVLATLGLVGIYGTIALRSERCAEAREQDLT
jgi:membrane protease YdiL (CAAX protease family)